MASPDSRHKISMDDFLGFDENLRSSSAVSNLRKEDLPVASSDILSKHSANISRLAAAFGINQEELSTAKKRLPDPQSQDSIEQFDVGKFKERLHLLTEKSGDKSDQLSRQAPQSAFKTTI